MKPADYEYLSNFLLGTSGLALGQGKEYLLQARLEPLANSWGLATVDELVRELRKGSNPTLSAAVTDAMTTNETSFFRDKVPFDELRTSLLPGLIASRHATRTLRIWCAAASTGQEPYSLALLLREDFPQLANWNVEILATDISKAALDRARGGRYSQFEVQRGLPVQYLMKHFEQSDGGWQLKDDVRRQIRWQQINLLDDFSRLGLFDLVFCRNVLIYFQNETKRGIFDRIARQTLSDGYLFLGAAETVIGISDSFRRLEGCRAAVYTPAMPVALRA
jgi:chemotaxis protein methyltransferase CheR